MFLVASKIPKSVAIQKHLTSIHIDNWLKQDVFLLRWWLLLGLIFVALLLWWKLLHKSKLNEIFLFTVLATILALGLVEYGEELTLWDYPTDIIPIFPPLTSINLISLPLIYSLIYQYFRTKKSFLWATLIITAVICFILEPILVWGDFYQLLHWHYFFSFPIYVLIALFTRTFVIKICKITEKYRNME